MVRSVTPLGTDGNRRMEGRATILVSMVLSRAYHRVCYALAVRLVQKNDLTGVLNGSRDCEANSVMRCLGDVREPSQGNVGERGCRREERFSVGWRYRGAALRRDDAASSRSRWDSARAPPRAVRGHIAVCVQNVYRISYIGKMTSSLAS